MIKSAIACVYILALLAFGTMARLPLAGAVITSASFMALAYSGIVFLRELVPAISSPVSLCIFGAVFGMVCGRVSLLIAGLCIGPSFLASTFSLGVLVCAAFLLARLRPRPPLSWKAENWHELHWILGLNAAVLLAMALPVWGAGHLTPKGFAFVPHFDLDFFNHIATTAEIAYCLPPQNPYFAGQTLHYYWFYHLWPASVIGLSGVTARDALLLSVPATVFLFVAALIITTGVGIRTSLPRYLAVALGLFAYSYIGVVFVMGAVMRVLVQKQADKIFGNYSYLSHSWIRDFLYEPHAVTAVTLLVFLFYVTNDPKTQRGLIPSLVSGLILGVIPITDSFIGLIALLWFALMKLGPFLRKEESRVNITASFMVALGLILMAFRLQILPVRGDAFRFAIHPMAKIAPVYLLVEHGPLFVFAVVGFFCRFHPSAVPFRRSCLLLLGVALFLGFSVLVPLEPNIVIRKGIKAAQFPFVILASFAFSRYLDLPSRHWIRLAGIPVVIAGCVTLCTDIYQYTDLESERTPPTTYISPDKMRSLDWIRNRTPRDAIVQLLDEVRPERSYADTLDLSIPALGERRTLFGNYKLPYLTHVAKQEIDERIAILEKVYSAKDSQVLRHYLDRLPPHYILVDRSSPGPLSLIQRLTTAGYLKEVFRAGEITVVLKGG